MRLLGGALRKASGGRRPYVGLRLKQSGKRWTVRGANAIIALRCSELSGRWEEFWEARSVG